MEYRSPLGYNFKLEQSLSASSKTDSQISTCNSDNSYSSNSNLNNSYGENSRWQSSKGHGRYNNYSPATHRQSQNWKSQHSRNSVCFHYQLILFIITFSIYLFFAIIICSQNYDNKSKLDISQYYHHSMMEDPWKKLETA